MARRKRIHIRHHSEVLRSAAFTGITEEAFEVALIDEARPAQPRDYFSLSSVENSNGRTQVFLT